MPGNSFRIFPAETTADFAEAAILFRAYAASLDIDLAYQDFEAELAALPGKYAPPSGALLLALGSDGLPLGCVALRPLEADGCCEMKRLFVTPQARGMRLGRALVDAIILEAEQMGYSEMRLDTLGTMTEALALYKDSGFEPIAPYYDTPIAETVFLAKRLSH
jgi:ribosomal protein S18 acetylase RimI-like enzyme